MKNEKCLFSNTQEFLHNIFITSLNRYQRFIHSVGGFKKPIYRYTNQANISSDCPALVFPPDLPDAHSSFALVLSDSLISSLMTCLSLVPDVKQQQPASGGLFDMSLSLVNFPSRNSNPCIITVRHCCTFFH